MSYDIIDKYKGNMSGWLVLSDILRHISCQQSSLEINIFKQGCNGKNMMYYNAIVVIKLTQNTMAVFH